MTGKAGARPRAVRTRAARTYTSRWLAPPLRMSRSSVTHRVSDRSHRRRSRGFKIHVEIFAFTSGLRMTKLPHR